MIPLWWSRDLEAASCIIAIAAESENCREKNSENVWHEGGPNCPLPHFKISMSESFEMAVLLLGNFVSSWTVKKEKQLR